MTIYHLRDLYNGSRLRIHCDDARVYVVPQLEGLSIGDMLEWANKYPEVAKALPAEPRDIDHLHRKYISSIIYTLVGEPFKQWVTERREANNQKSADTNNLTVMLDPEIAAILQKSTKVSSKSL